VAREMSLDFNFNAFGALPQGLREMHSRGLNLSRESPVSQTSETSDLLADYSAFLASFSSNTGTVIVPVEEAISKSSTYAPEISRFMPHTQTVVYRDRVCRAFTVQAQSGKVNIAFKLRNTQKYSFLLDRIDNIDTYLSEQRVYQLQRLTSKAIERYFVCACSQGFIDSKRRHCDCHCSL